MANYRRFITYLFRYEQGEKKEQRGYAKVEQRQNVGRVDIHLKNCGEEMVEVRPYFFAKGKRVPIGTMTVKNRVAEGSFRFDCSRLGDSEMSLQDVAGLVIPLGGQQLVFSQWDDEVYSWEELIGIEERRPPQEEVIVEEEVISQQEVQPARNMRQQIQGLRPRIYPFQGDTDTWAVKAQIGEVRYLPEKYWNLNTNSFVLRGYFKYGSILIGCMETDNRWFVGVPGIYCRQEKMIASMFGFHEFRGKNVEEVAPGHYGYWCCFLDADVLE